MVVKEINYTDKIYPKKLKEIKKSPKKIYILGNENLLNKFSIAIVGSRKCTQYGAKVAEYFSKELSLRDVVIISGMAVGIDSIAHKKCIENGGKTIAVIGAGFNNIYPKENEKLFNDILDNNGLVISEYPPDTKIDKKNFKQRNRIISGLSNGVILAESKKRSGTTITGNWAIEQGKELFVIPNNIFEESSQGCHQFLKKRWKSTYRN